MTPSGRKRERRPARWMETDTAKSRGLTEVKWLLHIKLHTNHVRGRALKLYLTGTASERLQINFEAAYHHIPNTKDVSL